MTAILSLQGMDVRRMSPAGQSIFSGTSVALCPFTTIAPASTASVAVC
ncbi:hypothetical protein [Micrococcus luteus]|nr:hypothetical protein [Micrococcus luteus]MCK6056791.1 hypothetical protein [Micrococcus luteus]MCK6061522.1 hypothetical protein [Micrococcus luteus]MCK6063983.1 hypothetical protein [Micrococcus luteus]MCK6192244.1 hypothetical protein [Micrococcus luteus]MCK6194324.1 hypothetical protein [Micrococcus luteus]